MRPPSIDRSSPLLSTRMVLASMAFASLAIIVSPISAQVFPEPVTLDAVLTASEASAADFYGQSVAIDGYTAVIGAPGTDHLALDSGSVHVFTRYGASWLPEALLVVDGANPGDRFGTAVAIDGEVMVGGAIGDDSGGTSAGAVYVFRRTGTSWSQEAKLPGAPRDVLGVAVAIDGDTLAAGGRRGRGHGVVYVFRHAGSGWALEAELAAPDGQLGTRFGWSVAVEGDTLAVAAPFDREAGTAAGAVYLFERDGTSWSATSKILQPEPAPSRQFGLGGVSLSGGRLLVGAPRYYENNRPEGAAYLLVREAGGWVVETRLVDSDPLTDRFGWSVALDGERALVGSPSALPIGAACLFTHREGSWTEAAKLVPPDSERAVAFGEAVALSGTVPIVGVRSDSPVDGSCTGCGAAYTVDTPLVLGSPPVALCAPVTVSAGPACAGDAVIDAGSFDPDGGAVTLFPEPAGPYPLGETLVNLTVTDDAGETASCQATVTVVDQTPPVLGCPAAVTLAPDTACQATVPDLLAQLIASDNCSAPSELTLLQTPPAGSALGLGLHPVVIAASDAAGNTASCESALQVPLGFDGFLPPIAGGDATGGSFGNPVRSFKLESTIAVKFQIDCAGAPALEGLHTLEAVLWSDATGADPALEATPRDAATEGNAFRLSGEQWHFNLDARTTGMSPGQWQLRANLADGSVHFAWVEIR